MEEAGEMLVDSFRQFIRYWRLSSALAPRRNLRRAEPGI